MLLAARRGSEHGQETGRTVRSPVAHSLAIGSGIVEGEPDEACGSSNMRRTFLGEIDIGNFSTFLRRNRGVVAYTAGDALDLFCCVRLSCVACVLRTSYSISTRRHLGQAPALGGAATWTSSRRTAITSTTSYHSGNLLAHGGDNALIVTNVECPYVSCPTQEYADR